MLPVEKRIQSYSQYKEWVTYELKKYQSSKFNFFLELFNITENAISRKHTRLLRKTEYYKNTGKKIRYKLLNIRLNAYQNKYCLHIPLNCFEKGLKLMHVGPILVNPNCVIGEDCSMHINTALAAGGVSDYAPVLGRGVVVGVGAVCLGGITIADYVAIGANAVVNKDVIEENIAIAGAPAKKVSNNGSKEWNKFRKGEKQ